MTKQKKRIYRDEQIALMKTRGLWPVPEVAEKLKIAPSTLYWWMDDGKVEHTTVGSARYVRIKSVRDYIGRDNAAVLGIL